MTTTDKRQDNAITRLQKQHEANTATDKTQDHRLSSLEQTMSEALEQIRLLAEDIAELKLAVALPISFPAFFVSSMCELQDSPWTIMPHLTVPDRDEARFKHEIGKQGIDENYFGWATINVDEGGRHTAEADIAWARLFVPNAKLAAYAGGLQVNWPTNSDAIVVKFIPTIQSSATLVNTAIATGREVVVFFRTRFDERHAPNAFQRISDYDIHQDAGWIASKGLPIVIDDTTEYWLRTGVAEIVNEVGAKANGYLQALLKHQISVAHNGTIGFESPPVFSWPDKSGGGVINTDPITYPRPSVIGGVHKPGDGSWSVKGILNCPGVLVDAGVHVNVLKVTSNVINPQASNPDQNYGVGQFGTCDEAYVIDNTFNNRVSGNCYIWRGQAKKWRFIGNKGTNRGKASIRGIWCEDGQCVGNKMTGIDHIIVGGGEENHNQNPQPCSNLFFAENEFEFNKDTPEIRMCIIGAASHGIVFENEKWTLPDGKKLINLASGAHGITVKNCKKRYRKSDASLTAWEPWTISDIEVSGQPLTPTYAASNGVVVE